MSDRETVEALLGTTLDAGWAIRLHAWSPDGDLDYRVAYASVELARDAAAELVARAGLTTTDAAAFALVLLPGAWSVEPGDPPPWWPRDPTALDDQVAGPLGPNGWVVCGYGDDRLWLLGTATPAPAEVARVTD